MAGQEFWFFLAGREAKTANEVLLRLTGIPFNNATDDSRIEGKLTGSINDSHRISATFTENDTSSVRTATPAGSTLDTVTFPSFPNDLFIARYDVFLFTGSAAYVLSGPALWAFHRLRGRRVNLFEGHDDLDSDHFDEPRSAAGG